MRRLVPAPPLAPLLPVAQPEPPLAAAPFREQVKAERVLELTLSADHFFPFLFRRLFTASRSSFLSASSSSLTASILSVSTTSSNASRIT